jgi:hypothetical protein
MGVGTEAIVKFLFEYRLKICLFIFVVLFLHKIFTLYFLYRVRDQRSRWE